MRAIVASALLALTVGAPTAWAQQGEPASSAGCGVGSILFEGQKGPVPQILAVTTNGSFGNQTFGITTGTLGCEKDGVVRSPTKVRMMVVSSLDNLAVDVARGEGETLDSLASLMTVAPQDKARFAATLQHNFTRLFPSENVTADEVIASMNAVLAEDAVLQRYVVT
jgi:Protein of unknown function (DUF3015)